MIDNLVMVAISSDLQIKREKMSVRINDATCWNE